MNNYTVSDQEVFNALLRENFLSFAQKSFATVDQQSTFESNWHIDATAYELLQCKQGKNNRLIITQPPRSLKTIIISIAFVAWMLGHNPALRFIVVSYSDKLAIEFNRQFKMIVESDWYQRLFPAFHIKKNTETELVTSQGGGRFATSTGGTLTGRGADFIIIDDPLKAEDGQSETAREKLINWYSNTLVTRLNNKISGVIILVMQRLHEEDIAGYLLEHGEWRHLNLRAIAEQDEQIQIGDGQYYHRKKGEPLHKKREPLEILEAIKKEIGSLQFTAQYQQRPVPTEGNLIKRAWLQKYKVRPKFEVGDRIVQSWDIASTISQTSDYSVCTTWLIQKDKFYLLHVDRVRLEFPDLKKCIVERAFEYSAKTVLIEDIGPGTHLLQQFKHDPVQGFSRPIGIKPTQDKLTRMHAETSKIEAGQFYLPEEADWLADFVNELLAFPSGRYDDQVDSVSQFLSWAGKNRPLEVYFGVPELIYLKEF